MPQELEIKLTVAAPAQIRIHNWLLAHGPGETSDVLKLVNRYYDTPDAALRRHRAALRVRDTGQGFVQTLKTQGEFAQGAHRRHEWEWPLESAELDPAMLDQTPLAQALDPEKLAPVFETNFQRRLLLLEDDQARIECAFDSGHIEADGRRRPLHEVELELKSGEEGRLLVWARALAEAAPVFLNLVSKAEQGYELAGLGGGEHHLPDEPVQALMEALSQAWLRPGRSHPELIPLLDAVESLAGMRGASHEWHWLREQMNTQEVPPGIFEDSRMGRFQLALLGP